MKRKAGEVREDGMVFFRYNSKKEIWITKEKFDEKIKIKREYYKNNKDKLLEKKRKWAEKNVSKVKNYSKKYYNDNLNNKRDQWNHRSRENRKKCENKLKFREYFRKYHYDRRLKDNLYRLKGDIRSRILAIFKKTTHKKTSRIRDIIGCSFEELKVHLESQFQQGMSWENRHLWHIDHIMPISMAKTKDEIIRLNHYKNLRPLWAHENLSKKDKTPEILILF